MNTLLFGRRGIMAATAAMLLMDREQWRTTRSWRRSIN